MSVRSNYMSDDELVERFRVDFELLEARMAAHPDGPRKHRAEALVAVAHEALDRVRKLAMDDGVVLQSSGDKDPTPP